MLPSLDIYKIETYYRVGPRLGGVGDLKILGDGGKSQSMAKRETPKSPGLSGEKAWKQFLNDKNLIHSQKVTHEELEFLSTVSLFGRVKSVKEILFILKNVRSASDTDLKDRSKRGK